MGKKLVTIKPKSIVKPTSQNTSPAEMIKAAVTGGADLDKLEKLLNLQERWESNEARKAYHKSMAAFKANPPKIDKDKKVSIQHKNDSGTTKYDHASLANVCEKINGELSKHGLSASWTTKQNGAILVTCRITHIQGHSEETTLSALADTTGSKNAIQAIGSTITYLQRYTLLSLTGLATNDQDDDGATATEEYISPDQVVYLQNLAEERGVSIEKLKKYMKVDTLEEILKSNYPKAELAIKSYIRPK